MKKFSALTLFCLLSAAFISDVAAQTSAAGSQPARFAAADRSAEPQAGCPTVKVSCPSELKPGEVLKFTASVTGAELSEDTTYNWMLSKGSISRGQGSRSIDADISEVPHNETITATLVVGGFARSCPTSASCTTTVSRRVESSKLDEYPNVAPGSENARLNAFARQLQEKPDAQANILVYAGRRSPAGAAQAAANRVKTYLIKRGEIDKDRIVTVDGGYKEELAIELWIVPPGASPPPATPTVDPGEITPKKPPAKQTTRPRRKS